MAADPPKPTGNDFVTSGARAPRKPKIEVLEPGSTAPPAAGVAGTHREEPLVDPADSREPLGSRKAERPPEIMRGEPSARMRAPATEADRTREPTDRRGNGFQFTPRVMLLGLLALAVLAALYGFFAVERGQDADSAGTEAAVREASPAFPEDTGPYVEPEASDEAQQAAAAEVREQEQLAANAETATPPGMSVELPTAAPQRVERQPAPATQRPRAEARPEPRKARPAAEPEPADDEPSAPGSTGALQTVGAFYSALSEGDGTSAASLVVPAKRHSGPLSAGSLTRYFSSFRRPLRIRRATALDDDTVRVAYDYVLPDGRECRGQALVDVVQRGDRAQIARIRTRGPC